MVFGLGSLQIFPMKLDNRHGVSEAACPSYPTFCLSWLKPDNKYVAGFATTTENKDWLPSCEHLSTLNLAFNSALIYYLQLI